MTRVNGSPSQLERLVSQGLPIPMLSRLVGCSVVTLYRARSGKQILEVYTHRLACVDRFCGDGNGSVALLHRIASQYTEATIWEQGLQSIANQLHQEESCPTPPNK